MNLLKLISNSDRLPAIAAADIRQLDVSVPLLVSASVQALSRTACRIVIEHVPIKVISCKCHVAMQSCAFRLVSVTNKPQTLNETLQVGSAVTLRVVPQIGSR